MRAGVTSPHGWLRRLHLAGVDRQVPGGRSGRIAGAQKSAGKPSPLQAAEVRDQLKAGLKQGHWRTAGQVRQWLAKTHGIQRAERSVYYWLGKLREGVLRVSRPVHIKRDPAAAAAFREQFAQKLVDLKLPQGRRVKVWVMDEARFGLHSQSRRCWGLRGVPVAVPRQHRHEWDYLDGAL